MNDEKLETTIDRRRALRVLGVGVATSGAALLAACKGDAKQPAATKKAEPAKAAPKKAEPAKAEGGACADPAKLDQQSKTLRETLKYVEKSPNADKKCSGCLQWTPGPKPTDCGSCKLFTGGVSPEGYCLSYAPATAG